MASIIKDDSLDILGYIGAVIIGLVLGLIGGGGSILTVPILVYILGVNPVLATAYSLFVVGSTALVGAVKNIYKGLVDFRTAIIFSIPAFITVYLTRKYLVPAIPETLFVIGDFTITKNIGIMLFFAVIMLIAAVAMILNRNEIGVEGEKVKINIPIIILEGVVIGVLTGIVGAGGGFLIIPALVLLAKLPMKKAVATSLLIIAVKSLIGFLGDVQNLTLNWLFLVTFTLCAIGGIFLGIYLSNYINGKKLKKSFGWFVLVMALYILYKELSS